KLWTITHQPTTLQPFLTWLPTSDSISASQTVTIHIQGAVNETNAGSLTIVDNFGFNQLTMKAGTTTYSVTWNSGSNLVLTGNQFSAPSSQPSATYNSPSITQPANTLDITYRFNTTAVASSWTTSGAGMSLTFSGP